MLVKHTIIYLFSSGIPSLIGFLSIAFFTRLLSPEAFGLYSLVVTGAVIANAVFYHWLQASLLRFLPQDQQNAAKLLSHLLGGFAVATFIMLIVGVALALIWGDTTWCLAIALGIVLTWTQGWFALNLELVRCKLAPGRYGLFNTLRGILSLGLGVGLIGFGYGVYGALLGLLLSYSVTGLSASWGQWTSIKFREFDWDYIHKILAYGLPLAASFATTVVIYGTDRFMLAGLIGESATGQFSAAQGLAYQAVGVTMAIVNLAALPLIIRTLEGSGIKAAKTLIRKSSILLFGVAFPVAAVFIFLAADIANVLLGIEFRAAAAELMPWLAVAAVFSGSRTYFFDLAFNLGKRTSIQMMIMTFVAILNVPLNLWLIPIHGPSGAAYASVIAHLIAVLLSAILGRRAFRLPAIHNDIFRLLGATMVMSVVLFIMPDSEGIPMLLLSLVLGGTAYLISVVAFIRPKATEAFQMLVGKKIQTRREVTRR